MIVIFHHPSDVKRKAGCPPNRAEITTNDCDIPSSILRQTKSRLSPKQGRNHNQLLWYLIIHLELNKQQVVPQIGQESQTVIVIFDHPF